MQKKEQFIKTHEKIKNTYKKLMIRDLSGINATMIAAESGISRNNFYLHYNSVNELTNDVVSELIDDITLLITELFVQDELTLNNIIIKLHSLIETNRDFYMKLISFVKESICEGIQNLFIDNPEFLDCLFPNNTKEEARTIFYGFILGLFSMYSFIFKNNINLSTDHISDLSKELFNI